MLPGRNRRIPRTVPPIHRAGHSATTGGQVSANWKCTQSCHVRLDRMIVVVDHAPKALPEIDEFETRRDLFVRSQTNAPSYKRVRYLENPKTGTLVWIRYQGPPWLPDLKITITPKRKSGLRRKEVDEILGRFAGSRILQLELAFDFEFGSCVDRDFVLKHGRFGKSREIVDDSHDTLHYGGRKSMRFARVYEKEEVNAFRVEIQFQTAWLRSEGISQPGDLCKLRSRVIPACLSFVELDWRKLERCLIRRGKTVAQTLLEQAHRRSASLSRLLKFLRHTARIPNSHRFLRRLSINNEMVRALRIWLQFWGCNCGC
jgi:hypothetical protein